MARGIAFSVSGNAKAVIADMQKLPDKVTNAAIANALTRAGKTTRAKATPEISAAVGVPANVVRKRITVAKASQYTGKAYLNAAVYLRTKPISAASLKPKASKRGGVKAGKRKFADAWYLPPGHSSGQRSGKAKGLLGITRKVSRGGKSFPKGIVLRRKGSESYPTEAVTVPILEAADPILRRALDNAGPDFVKQLESQLERRLKAKGNGA
jgi:hypothetical protein